MAKPVSPVFPVSEDREFLVRIVDSPEPRERGRELQFKRATTIGRDASCGVVLSERSVSRRHAEIETAAEGFRLKDLDSGNGVYVGEERIENEVIIESGQQFRIAATVLECVSSETRRDTDDDVTAIETAAFEREGLVREMERRAAEEEAGFVVTVTKSSQPGNVGKRFTISGTEAVVGRAGDCAISIDERDLSRRHLKIERSKGGFKVTDLGSTNGSWLGKAKITEAELKPGDAFRIGNSTELVCRPKPARSPDALPSERAAKRSAGAARTPEPDSPAHSKPVEKVAPASNASNAPKVKDTSREDDSDSALDVSPTSRPPTGTVVIPATAALVAATRSIEDEGEPFAIRPNQPFLLDDAQSFYYVVEGTIDIFTVAVEDGRPKGARTHFLGILAGQCFFGFDLLRYGMGSGFLAVGKQGTRLRKLPLSRVKQLASRPSSRGAVAALLDTWARGLTQSLRRDTEDPVPVATELLPGEAVALPPHAKATAPNGLVWLKIWSGGFLFNDMATPVFKGKQVLFPIGADSWLQSVSDEFGVLETKALSSEAACAEPEFWHGLDVFHQVLCECEFINKRLAAVDEFIRLQQKKEHVEAAKEAAYDAIGSVLSAETTQGVRILNATDTAPLLRACQIIGLGLDLEIKKPPQENHRMTYDEAISQIASCSGFRTRAVALRGDWWVEDHGPLLAKMEESGQPIALMPTSARSYEYMNPKTGARGPVEEGMADALHGFAYTFYRPFPDGEITAMDLIRFGAHGLRTDFRLLVLMGVIVGLLGTIAPYLTGRVFDSAIPQADRNMLLVFGLALFSSALGTAAFKFVQGIATVRVQGKMEYSIQAALWDRLLNLPTNFFRQFSAGDLSDRVNGVDQIQSLLSGAGIAAVLGSLSGLFYVVLMFTYNVRLAILAIFLTAVFVLVTMAANYLQLRHQRAEIALRGRISGLVLNLITGVTKLRICGAEHHAFRIWAQQFANQRRIAFTIGTIQNVIAVFNSVFPVLSSMAIFWIMIIEQGRAAETGVPGLTTGDFIAFNAAYGSFLAAMQSLGDASMNLLRVVPIYERLKPIITTPSEVDGSKAYPGKIEGDIELSHVHFRYHSDGPWIIKDLSLKMNPGEFVAFVGSSGCGKSTLMRLMLGFEQASMGSIYYDGQDVSSLDARMLRQQMGVVLQVSRVLPTDIYRNIVGMSARTIEEAWRAADEAGLAEDIRLMPMGMHTYVSEGGGTMSGGQRQRLLIARALVNRPKVMFLDEATSALDNKAQATVTGSMDKLDATRVVIAHRLSTVMNADKICYLDAGRIAEMGTYDELMEQNGLFAALAKRQMA